MRRKVITNGIEDSYTTGTSKSGEDKREVSIGYIVKEVHNWSRELLNWGQK